jgi:hypothetical protein
LYRDCEAILKRQRGDCEAEKGQKKQFNSSYLSFPAVLDCRAAAIVAAGAAGAVAVAAVVVVAVALAAAVAWAASQEIVSPFQEIPAFRG